ncbi:MAG: ABC transporter permease [Ignavibacteriae bacterium]|nr:ABC transporter permease [Ignavibacteriota bacterium]
MLSILLLFPVFLLVVFGYAVNFDVKNIKLAIYDQNNTELSREFYNSLISSNYFKISHFIKSDNDVKDVLDKKIAQCVLIIPKNFSQKFYSKENVKVQFLTDGVDGNTAKIIQNYVNGATANFNSQKTNYILSQKGLKSYIPFDFHPIFWFNKDLQTTRFLIPGLIAMILVIVAVVSVSLSLVREKERGTIEQINVSPINIIELLLGKTFPYIIVALFNAIFILIFGYLLFNVEIKGDYFLLAFTTIIFLFTSTSIGIFISTISDSQQIAFTIATMVSLLPSVILSGFIFPIESMPPFIQIITNITPAKFFIKILRAIILRGVGIEAIWDQILYLLIFAGILLFLSSKIYLKK